MTTNELSQIRRAMNEDPRELKRAKCLDWAIELVEGRLARIPVGTPARPRYEERLAILKSVQGRTNG